MMDVTFPVTIRVTDEAFERPAAIEKLRSDLIDLVVDACDNGIVDSARALTIYTPTDTGDEDGLSVTVGHGTVVARELQNAPLVHAE